MDEQSIAAAVVAALSGHEEAIAAAVVQALGAREVVATSPVAASGELTIYRGDDYVAAEGRALGFDLPDPLHLLLLDQKEAEVRLDAPGVTWVATDVIQTPAGYRATFEPTAEETAALTHSGTYEVEATTGSGHKATLATGALTVRRDIPAVTPDQP